MPVFAYRALTAGGRRRGGVVDATSARAAWQALRGQGVFPTEVRPQGAAARGGGPRVAAAELAAAARELATLVGAGVPIAEALAAVAEQTGHPSLERALAQAQARLREGEPLAAALGASPRVFSPFFRDLVRAGEESGALAVVLVRLAEHTEATAATRARLRAALTYPAVMMVATAAVLAFLLAWVVPQVTQLFADTGTPLPLPTRVLAAAGAVMAMGWPLGLALVAAGGWALGRWRATPAGRMRLDSFVLRLPLVGRIVRQAAVARLARTLATLLAGGVPLEAALGIAEAVVGNRALADAVASARAAVRQGQSLAAALGAAGVFPSLLVRLAAVGERGGTLGDALARAATSYEADVEAAVAAATALVEPLLIVVMGAVVLALVSAILLPLFSLSASVPVR
jgi:general secretion pathway protein F